ncbi:MAG: NAD(P)H-dependent glycerol-3-phosphate dehydrogenase [Bauldia litoralis]
MDRVLVVGGGAWGTALAMVARRAGRSVTLWAREAEVVEGVNAGHENGMFLPGVALDPAITAEADLAAAARNAEAVLLVTPAQHLRSLLAQITAPLGANVPLIIASKGIEQETGLLLSEVLAEAGLSGRTAVLSGPTFAAEVARGLPTAVTLAAEDRALAEDLALAIGGPLFRPYISTDVIGAQIGGAVKNVIAIACGIVHGRKLGENARAALITRGLAEIGRLGAAKGGSAQTLMGLSGLGDLTLTCNSIQSRNMSLGVALGEGRSLADVLGARNSVAEGVWTAQSVGALARRLGVEMPICGAVERILHEGADIEAEIEGLLSRPFRGE